MHDIAAQQRAVYARLQKELEHAAASGLLGVPLEDPSAARAIERVRRGLAALEAEACGAMYSLRERIGERPPRRKAS
jgi:hypothetical protein